MIWLIGCNGMLGKELSRSFEKAGVAFEGTDREVSILDIDALRTYAANLSPAWIVNSSAYTAVDKAEDEADAAFALNRDGISNIAELARELDIPVVHISTDYVFDGKSSLPLTEEAKVAPESVYGRSKLAGEEALKSLTDKYFIIRTAWLYGEFGNNFVFTMLKLMNSNNSVKVVSDQYGSPTWTRDLAGLILSIIKNNSNDFGTYHFSGEGQCSWYSFAEQIYRIGKEYELIDSDCSVVSCTSNDFPTKAKRPEYSLLSKEKVKKVFNIEIPDWNDSLSCFIGEIRNKKGIENEKA